MQALHLTDVKLDKNLAQDCAFLSFPKKSVNG